MKARAIFVVFVCCSICGFSQTSILKQVEALLDSSRTRGTSHALILKITEEPVDVLASIAESDQESDLRKTRAVHLLTTFRMSESEAALARIARQGSPTVRCAAMQAAAEFMGTDAISILAGRLSDQGVCMKPMSTDPAREDQVYVSDEAVRLLESITGKSFGNNRNFDHWETKPWKEWWLKYLESYEGDDASRRCYEALSGFRWSPSSTPVPPHPASLSGAKLVYFESGCFGTCPSFRLTMTPTRVDFEGRAFVKVQGKRQETITPAEFDRFVHKWFEDELFAMRPSYCRAACPDGSVIVSTDVQETSIELTTTDFTQKVYECYHTVEGEAGNPKPPDQYFEMRKEFQAFVRSKGWL